MPSRAVHGRQDMPIRNGFSSSTPTPRTSLTRISTTRPASCGESRSTTGATRPSRIHALRSSIPSLAATCPASSWSGGRLQGHGGSTRAPPLFAERAIARRPKWCEVFAENVRGAPDGHAHVAHQVVRVVSKVRADEITLVASREGFPDPAPHPLDLPVHLGDARQRELSSEAL